MSETTSTPDETTAATTITTPSTHAHQQTRYVRPARGRVVAGVAAGLAQTWALPAWLIRLGFAITSIGGGFGVVAYLTAWILMPQEGAAESAVDRMRRRIEGTRSTASTVGLAMIAVASIIALSQIGIAGRWVFIALLVIAGVTLTRSSDT